MAKASNGGTITDKRGKTHIVEDDYLTTSGFERLEDSREETQTWADEHGMDEGGPYFVRGVYRKGDVFLRFEVNVSTIDQGGMESQITHPQVCIVEGPKGRVAVSANDVELQLKMAEEMA